MKRRVSGSVYILVGALAGAVSAMAAIDSLGSSPVEKGSPWQSWNLAVTGSAHPYALDHFLMAGRLPPTTGQMREFAAQRSDAGDALAAECRYRLIAAKSAAMPRWWSLLAMSGRGDRRETALLSSDTAIAESDGSLQITVARTPASGNWIEAPAAGAFTLIYTAADPATVSRRREPPPFVITRVDC